jgi:hypothetical protein
MFRSAVMLCAALAAGACATHRVATDFDREVRFDQLRSFVWLEPAPEQIDDPLLDSPLLSRKIQRAAGDELVRRGYVQAASAAEADFFVTYHTTSRERIRDAGGVSFGFGYGTGYRRGHHSIFVGDRFGRVESYQEGTLIIDIVDARTRQLVWRGWTRGAVHPARFTDEAVDRNVRDILSRFPPGA